MSSAQDVTTQAAPAESSLRYAGWRVVLACFLMALFLFGFGLYGHGVFLVELQRLHGWPAASISFGSTLSLLISNILAMFTPELMARLGPKRLVLFGLAGFAASMVLLAGATELWQIYAAFTLMSLGWIGMGTVVIATVVSGWFDQRRGLAISLAFNGASCGGVIVTPLLVLLVEKVGFSTAMLISTAVMLVILLPVIVVWITPRRQGVAPAANPASSQMAAAEEISRMAIMRQPAFWTNTIAFALALTAQVGVIVHLIALLEPKLGRAGAGFAVSLLTAWRSQAASRSASSSTGSIRVGDGGVGGGAGRSPSRDPAGRQYAVAAGRLCPVRLFGRQPDHASAIDYPPRVQCCEFHRRIGAIGRDQRHRLRAGSGVGRHRSRLER